MANIIKIVDGISFIPRDDQTLLEALEAQEIDLDYQCRQGFCGTCQILLVHGGVAYEEEPLAFVPKDHILPCCCRPASDLIIELPQPCQPKKIV
jgi:ferredoxin